MTDTSTPVTWPRATWEAAGRATDYRLAWLCPLCPDENGLRIEVDGGQGFNVPLNWNAASFTISVPVEGDESKQRASLFERLRLAGIDVKREVRSDVTTDQLRALLGVMQADA